MFYQDTKTGELAKLTYADHTTNTAYYIADDKTAEMPLDEFIKKFNSLVLEINNDK